MRVAPARDHSSLTPAPLLFVSLERLGERKQKLKCAWCIIGVVIRGAVEVSELLQLLLLLLLVILVAVAAQAIQVEFRILVLVVGAGNKLQVSVAAELGAEEGHTSRDQHRSTHLGGEDDAAVGLLCCALRCLRTLLDV